MKNEDKFKKTKKTLKKSAVILAAVLLVFGTLAAAVSADAIGPIDTDTNYYGFSQGNITSPNYNYTGTISNMGIGTNTSNSLLGVVYCSDRDYNLRSDKAYYNSFYPTHSFAKYRPALVWIGYNGYFNDITRGISNFSKISAAYPGITESDAFLATQLAIWHFTDAADNMASRIVPGSQLQAFYNYLVEGALNAENSGGIVEVPTVQINVSATDKYVIKQEFAYYGPIKLTAGTLPAGGTIDNNRVLLDASELESLGITVLNGIEGSELSKNAGGSYILDLDSNSSGEIYLKIPAGTKTSGKKITASAVSSGQFYQLVIFGAKENDKISPSVTQVLISAVPADISGSSDISLTCDIPLPEVLTSAKDGKSGLNELLEDEKAVIIDTVAYKGLTIGQKYVIEGKLYDKESNSPLIIGGSEVVVRKVFTPDSESGTVDVTFEFDASGLNGQSLVVFEKLYYADADDQPGAFVAGHEDINDKDQTVEVFKVPELKTSAKDGGTGKKTIKPEDKAVVKDTVSYKNLRIGAEYEIKGTLYDKATKKPLEINGAEVTASVKFTAADSEGTIDLTFEFDASVLEGKTLVVFEKLYRNNIEVASHEDINDEDQTVTVRFKPQINTSAKDKLTGKKTLNARKNAKIVDVVNYRNLEIGESYTVEGILYDKATGNPFLPDGVNTVTASAVFTAEKENGSIELTFTFDATNFENTELVVFEKLFHNGIEIASHEDINDKDQTVKVIEEAPDTGDTNKYTLFYLAGMILSAAGIAAVLDKKKRVHN